MKHLVTILALTYAAIAPVHAKTVAANWTDVAHAQATLKNNAGANIGHVHVIQGTEGVLIHIEAKGLTPGKHGMHFHKIGDCSDHDHFKTVSYTHLTLPTTPYV